MPVSEVWLTLLGTPICQELVESAFSASCHARVRRYWQPEPRYSHTAPFGRRTYTKSARLCFFRYSSSLPIGRASSCFFALAVVIMPRAVSVGLEPCLRRSRAEGGVDSDLGRYRLNRRVEIAKEPRQSSLFKRYGLPSIVHISKDTPDSRY